VIIPFTLKRLRLDPAQSAFIWATAVTDCRGFLATLGIAAMCLKWLR
jgi:Mg/Co/Ni transporter MgtE